MVMNCLYAFQLIDAFLMPKSEEFLAFMVTRYPVIASSPEDAEDLTHDSDIQMIPMIADEGVSFFGSSRQYAIALVKMSRS